MSRFLPPAVGCGICPKNATFLCATCSSMPYCSSKCLITDQSSHASLCTTLSSFSEQHRPSPFHFRCIFLPVGATAPQFVWIKYYGRPDQLNIDREDLKRYISGSPSGGDAAFSDYLEADRNLKNRIIIQHDNNFLGTKQPQNKCVKALLGEQVSERWRGPLLAHSYKGHTKKLAYWTNSETAMKLIPVDLDTLSLPPILSFLKWRANYTDDYRLGAMLETEDHTSKIETPEETPKRKSSSGSSSRMPRSQSGRSSPEEAVEEEDEFS